jgi:hypothetical protein
VSPTEAARGLLIATGANSLLKAILAVGLGAPSMRLTIALVLGGTVLLSVLAAWMV